MGTIAQNLQTLVSERDAIKTAINNHGKSVGNSMSTYASNIADIVTDWLCFTCISETGSISFTKCSSKTGTLYWTKDKITWNTYSTTISLTYGERVWMRGSFSSGMSASLTDYSNFQMTGKIAASGNIMSLLSYPGAMITRMAASYCFYRLFYNCTSLVTAPELCSTHTTTHGCREMFYGCTSLVVAPSLPTTAITAQKSCYRSMFYGCTSLKAAPELPATTLDADCYQQMFYGCTSLVSAPELPATTLDADCYQQMFYGCTSLVSAPELPATTLASNCYRDMFSGCTALASVPELPATTLASSCYNSMFKGCTSLVTAPELPATTLDKACYHSMFRGCTKITKSPVLPVTDISSYDNPYAYMFNGCSSLRRIEAHFTTTPSNTVTNQWVNGVASSGVFVKGADATWTNTGVHAAPSGWTIERELPTSKSDSTSPEPLTYPINYTAYVGYSGSMDAVWSVGESVGRLKYNGEWHDITVASLGPSVTLNIADLTGCTISVVMSASNYGWHSFGFSMAQGYDVANITDVAFVTG